MSRIAKPIETLLKMKQIKPDIEFTGADRVAYEAFIDAEAEENLISAIKEAEVEEVKPVKKTRKKSSKKVKQTINPEIVETGEVEPINETIDIEDQEEIRAEEEHESI